MAEESDMTVPIDVPWQLLSRRGPDSAEDQTSIATFIYIPPLPEFEAKYPDDRLVYFKFSVSVFPFRLDVPRVPPFEVFDEAFAPVWRMILEVEITRRGEPEPRGFKPYFLSAAPTRRAMVETGVVGDYFTEGESDEVAISRTGSHLIEGFHSTTKTRKFGVGAMGGIVGGGFLVGGSLSHSRSTTSISGGREVSEQVDTTNRQASEERRELLSHTTNVNNVLTLLNGSLVGTHMLHFSLWPQPLRPLSIDPDDENLWYAELLKRRSSGIEGMQDFYAVAVVPRGEGFCLNETLRRVSVMEPPLPEPPVEPFKIFDTFDFNLTDFVRVLSYLMGKYPEGTPLEELDVSVEDRLFPDPAAVPPFPSSRERSDLQAYYNAVGTVWVPNPLPPLPPEAPIEFIEKAQLNAWAEAAQGVLATLNTAVKIDTVPRPVVSGWTLSNSLRPSMFRLHALTNPPSLPVPYKWVQDIWMEAAQYDYEAELAKSPLERGTILLDDRRVDICADLDEEGVLGDVTTTVPGTPGPVILGPLGPSAVVRPWDLTAARDPRAKGRAMTSAWGMAEAQLRSRISGASNIATRPLSFQETRVLELFLRRSTRLSAGDRRNLTLVDAARQFGIGIAELAQLKSAGITNLSSLASAILDAWELERLGQVQPFPNPRRGRHALTSGPLPPRLVTAVVRAIGEALDASLQKHERVRPLPRHQGPPVKRRRKRSRRSR